MTEALRDSDQIVVSKKLEYEPFKLSELMKLQTGHFREYAEPMIERMNKRWLSATRFEGHGFSIDAAQQYGEALEICEGLRDRIEIIVGRESQDWRRLEELSINFSNIIMVYEGNRAIEGLMRGVTRG